MERVRNLLAYTTYKGLKVYQMYVKSIFLNGILEEDVYIEKPKGFVDENNKDKVCKLYKALYGLKQAPRAWYEIIYKYLVQIGFERTDVKKICTSNQKKVKTSLYLKSLWMT